MTDRKPRRLTRALTGTLAFACLALAIAWPGWRGVIAQTSGYLSNVSLLTCTGDGLSPDLVVTSSQSWGTEAFTVPAGTSCARALSAYGFFGWSIRKEDQFITEGLGFGTMYRLGKTRP